MRTQLLALATSAALGVVSGGFKASAQPADYGYGWHEHRGDGYRGRSDYQRGGYGPGRRERGERYDRREDQGEGYGRRERDRREGMMDGGLMAHGMVGPGMMGPAMMRMMLVLMDTDAD